MSHILRSGGKSNQQYHRTCELYMTSDHFLSRVIKRRNRLGRKFTERHKHRQGKRPKYEKSHALTIRRFGQTLSPLRLAALLGTGSLAQSRKPLRSIFLIPHLPTHLSPFPKRRSRFRPLP